MRGILFSTIVAAGIALLGAPTANASPFGGMSAGLLEAAGAASVTDQVHYRRYRHSHRRACRCVRYNYRGRCVRRVCRR